MTDRAIKALLIEDNPLDARLIREHLSEVTGARVALDCADCLSSGMERLRKTPPDVLLLDLGLPESQGLETLSRVLAEAPGTPVVVITGLDDEERAYQAVAEGAQDYLVKGRVNGQLVVRSMRYAMERQQADEALRESEERYRELVENANDIVYSHDLEGNFTSVNPSGCRVYGYTTEEILGMNIAQIVDPEFLPLAQSMIERKLAGDTATGPYELLTYTKSHEPVWAEVSTRLRRKDDRPLEVQGIARDITERKRLDEALGRERDRAQQYLDLAPVMFVALNPQGEVTLVNKRGCELLGREEIDIVGRNWFDTFAPQAVRDEIKKVFAQLMAGEVEPAEYFENPILTSAGEEKIIAWHNTVLRDEAGTIFGTLSSGSDITDRRRAAQALQRLMDFNESIIQNVAEVILVTDSQGYITFANPACAALLGYTVEELVGLHWTAVVPPDQHHTVETADERRARAETDHYELEVMRQDSERVSVLVSGSPRFQGGQFAGTLAVLTDITELKRAQEWSRRRSEELAALNAVAASVTSTLNLEQVVGIIEDRVRVLLGENHPPVLGLFNEATEAFDFVLTSASARLLARAGEVTGIRLELEELSFPLASVQPDPRAALLAGKPYVTDDVSTIVGLGIGRKVVQAAQKALGIRCIAGLPLWAKGRLVGCMVLFSRGEEISEAQIELLASIGRHAAIAIDNATLYRAAAHEIAQRQRAQEQLRLSHDRLREALDQTVMALAAAVETRDPYTAGHQRGVADLAVSIAQELGLPEEQARGIRIAGLVHDIGKIQIPAEILSKPTRLTDPEWSMIKAHPQAGHDILKTVEFPWPVSQIVLQHHERMDGSGYPQGLSGEDILLDARILAVADVVEAMASHRPYRPAHTLEKTMEEIRSNRGILYDIEVVDACLRLHADKRVRIG